MSGQRAERSSDCRLFHAGDVVLESGVTLRGTLVGYVTFGALNERGDNAIVVPTHFGGTHVNSTYLIGEDMALDPRRYFIVVVNLLGNGISSSPSLGSGPMFPRVSVADNIHVQYRLLTEALKVQQIALVAGFSMGGMAAYHWAALYPRLVVRAASICGAARISRHNYVFIEGMRGILTADPSWHSGYYETPPLRGLRAMARAWAAWPPSAHFYRHALYERLGYRSLEDFLQRYWESTYCAMDANNLLAQMRTWQSADISANNLYRGDFTQALAAIEAKMLVMPCVNDAYFPPEDSELEIAHMRHAEYRPINSSWGHWAGSGRNPDDTAFIDAQLRELLAWQEKT